VRFGVIYLLQLPRPWREDSEERVYREALEQIVLADRLGFDYAWAAEHHFLEEYSHCSAPEVFLAAAAARTDNLRLGPRPDLWRPGRLRHRTGQHAARAGRLRHRTGD
jgi:hypothetical protein